MINNNEKISYILKQDKATKILEYVKLSPIDTTAKREVDLVKYPVKSWIDTSLIDFNPTPKSPRRKSKSESKVNPKEIPLKYLYRVNSYTRLQNEVSNSAFLDNQLKLGFTPKWYIVFHISKPRFGYKDARFAKGLVLLREQLFRILYGNKWYNKTHRARAIWVIELGKSKHRPHINLLIEELPSGYESLSSIDKLFNKQLPKKVKCMWRDSANVEEVYSSEIHGYLCKEYNSELPNIIETISDIL